MYVAPSFSVWSPEAQKHGRLRPGQLFVSESKILQENP
jgi:hypothetical protein